MSFPIYQPPKKSATTLIVFSLLATFVLVALAAVAMPADYCHRPLRQVIHHGHHAHHAQQQIIVPAIIVDPHYSHHGQLHSYDGTRAIVGQDLYNEAQAKRTAYWVVKYQQEEALKLEQRAPVNPDGTAPGTSPVGDDARAQTIFDRSCVGCHSATLSSGGLDLSDISKLSRAQLMSSAVKSHLGTMPKNGEPIPNDEADFLMKWVEKR